VCNKCSEAERKSFVAESSVVKLKKYRLLDKYFDEDDSRIYKVLLTNVTVKGITFDVDNLGIEGFIPIRMLSDDYYIFDEKRMKLTGRHKGFTFTIGDILQVQLTGIDLVFLEAEWTLI
jgi:ribonuclease R